MHWNELRSHVRHLSSKDQERLKQAFDLGKRAHEGQKRKSGEPYFTHPIAVADKLADMGADADTLIAALLHDTIEDTPLILSEIEEAFGSNVAALVDGVTKFHAHDFSGSPSLDEKIETLRKMFTLLEQDVRTIVIKLVDRLHNMQTIEFYPREKQPQYAQETLDVYVKVADRLSMLDMRDELETLCLTVLEPQFSAMAKLRAKNEKVTEKIIKRMEADLKKEPPKLQLQYEYKKWDKIKIQLEHNGRAITGVSNANIAVVCNSIEDCYAALGLLHSHWRREHLSFQDFINAPMINGYRGLHTTVIMDDGSRVRCKIRTEEMHAYARQGITSLCFDSEPVGLLDYIPWAHRIHELAEDTSDRSEDFWQSLQSDILGESITIHGIDDQAIMLPEGSTVLDGAFYSYNDKALQLTRIEVNGKEVPLSTPLENGVSLTIDIDTKTTARLEWLQCANTGLATAKIRAALATQPKKKRQETGKQLLQEVFDARKKGFIDEFDPESLRQRLHAIHYKDLESAYLAIADGRLEPTALFEALFAKSEKSTTSRLWKYTVQFSLSPDQVHTLSEYVHTVELQGGHVQQLDYKQRPDGTKTVTMNVRLPRDKEQKITKALHTISDVRITLNDITGKSLSFVSIPVLSTLWALDCLLGKLLITGGVSPFDLTTLRFAVLILMSSAYLLASSQLTKSVIEFKKLSPYSIFLFIAGGAIFMTALSSYIAVQTLSTITYGMCMNIGIAALLLWNQSQTKTPSIPLIATTAAFVLATLIMLIYEAGSLWTAAAWGGIGCGVGFALYTVSSRKYQTQEAIRSRYPLFILYFSIIAFCLSLPFVLTQGFSLHTSHLFLPAITFVAVLTALPYIIYFELLKFESIKVTWSYVPLFLFLMVIGEYFIYDTWDWRLILPLLLGISWWQTYEPESDT